jgi:hypothetical protein
MDLLCRQNEGKGNNVFGLKRRGEKELQILFLRIEFENINQEQHTDAETI